MCAYINLSIFENILSGIEKVVHTFLIPNFFFFKNKNYYVILRHTLSKSIKYY